MSASIAPPALSARWRSLLRRALVPLCVGPPRWTFAALDLLSRAVDVKRLPTALAAAQALGLEGEVRARFCRRAWAGAKASEVLWQRLERRPAEAATLVAHSDLASVESAVRAGRGVILAAAHIGPERVMASHVRRRFPETLFLLHEPEIILGPARARSIDEGSNRAAALVEANRHLRSGGLVYIAPDGISGALSVTLPLGGGSVRMSRGVATLARLSGAAAVPVAAAWVDGAVWALSGPPIAAASDAAAEVWERAWLGAYLAQLERWTRELPPENLRLHGSIYQRWQAPPNPGSTPLTRR